MSVPPRPPASTVALPAAAARQLQAAAQFLQQRDSARMLAALQPVLAQAPDHPDALATYEYSEDGKTLTFTLRDDAYWHDGTKITPEDIKWSIEYVAKTPVCNPVFMSTFKAIAGSDEGKAETFSGIVIDGQKITITFDKIAPDALLTFTQFAPVPKASFEGIDPLQVQQAPYFQSPIGSGPFCIEEVSMKNFTMLKPFDQYYNGVAEFKIQLLPSAGDSDANITTRAKSGQIDYAYTKMISDVQAIEGTPGVTVTPIDVRYTRLMYMNKFPKADGTPAPLADPKVRQAIRYAVDNAAIALRVLGGHRDLTWYVPVAEAPAEQAASGPWPPPWLGPLTLALGGSVAALMVWRGRRLGRLVTEPLPVVVAAHETTLARGHLYRRARDPGHAARILAGATRARLAEAVGLPATTDPRALATAVAAATGRATPDVGALLDLAPTSDADLARLGADLAQLEKEVRRT